MILALALLASLGAPPSEVPCAEGTRPLVILGVFHMSNPGQDAVNREVDMTTPQRQKEIEELVEKLARFQPTKIAIESARNSNEWNERYQRWLKGEYTLGYNEIEQIGFRLARKLGLPGLTPVDYPMWMSGLTPIERHEPKRKAAPRPAAPPAEPSPEMVEVRAQVAKDEEHLATHTVAEHLTYLNEPARAAMNHRWDALWNLVPGEGVALYSNADLVTNWYKRNIRIFTNILDATNSTDRVLLLIGAGHVKILSDWASEHQDVCLVDAAMYLK